MSKNRLTICIGVCLLFAVPLTVAMACRELTVKRAQANEISQENAPDEDVPQGLRFELRPSGFIPAENEVTSGRYMLLLQNRSGLRELNLILEREHQGRVAQSDQHRPNWRAKVQLAPGTYILREANHPEWLSVIRVRPR